ncbi:MAG: FecCD family ABC transporter permease [Candidatus Binatia bacterium]
MTSARLTSARAVRVLAVLAVILVAAIVGSALIGAVSVDLARAFRFDADDPDFVILFRARLPRVFLGAAVGGGLAAAGSALQALLRNSLASPDVIGVSGGASVGAIVVLGLGFGEGAGSWLAVPFAAFTGSLVAIGVIVRLATVRARLNPYSLLLVGVIVNTITSAVILLVSAMVESSRAQSVLFWLSGSLAQRSWGLVASIWLYVVLATLVLWTQSRRLNLLALGEEAVRQLGVDVDVLRRATFVAAAFLVGAAVSVSGVIGFVGLIVPHALRLLFGSDQRLLVPASFLGGAIFLVVADTAARSLFAPVEIPVGVVTAICGGPFFIYLLRREQARSIV